MIFFLINRFRRKKLRARESRQTAEDQRSIVGSIGYIAGNMGYMEGNLGSMDYTYGGAATHYPLWKPPSGYFPRGEAPPPYDEAVAISQAEALSAQCAAAAAAAQVAANQRATLSMNTVDLQNADMARRAQATQMQQIQHHAQPQQQTHSQLNHQPTHVVPTLQAHVLNPQNQQQSNQSHQITQSTTNLINININSGGNITTIATGENHQPPYSLQDENGSNTGLMQQQSSQLATQQLQMQQQQQQMIQATTANGLNSQGNGRVNIAQSNSICVQTMTPINQQQQQQQQQMPANQNAMQTTQIMANGNLNNLNNCNTLSRQPAMSQNLVVNTSSTECGYKNCHLNGNNSTNTVSRRLQRNTEPLQQYVVDVEVNVGSNRGYHSLPPCNNAATTTEMEVIASPTQFSNNTSNSITAATSTPAINQVSSNSSQNNDSLSTSNSENCSQLNNSGHNTLPLQHTSQNNKSSNSNSGVMKTPSSSSKRYHRTMPRYYTVADPLSNRESQNSNTTNTTANKSSSKTEAKLAVNNTTTNGNNSSTNSSISSSKKPTCQCPVQHVPMSYMGSTQLTNAQNVSNNAFFTVLSNKLTSSNSNSSPTTSQHSQRLQTNASNTNSLNYQQRPKSSQSLSHTTGSVGENISNNTLKRSVANHCNYDSKIATISTGELHSSNSGNNQQQLQQQQQHHHNHVHGHVHHGHHSSSLLLPPQHHDDSSPIVLGRVTKRSSSSSSGDRLRSASSGSTRSSVAESVCITSPAAAAYLNSKVDAYLNFTHGTNHHLKANDLMNPALPPKLHKSLTNLKTSSSSTTTSSSATITTNNTNNHRQQQQQHKYNDNGLNNKTNNSNTTSTNCNNTSYNNTSSAPLAPSSSTTSVQTIYTLSKPHHTSSSSSSSPSSNPNTTTTIIGLNSSSASSSILVNRKDHDHIMKIQQPPSLTLPLSTTSTTSSFTSSTSKINTSTFYPLQNNVTYTLPKNTGGKMSLNSTINSVVSKVPSVISLPSSSGTESNNNNNLTMSSENYTQHPQYSKELTATSMTSKSTTLPKILRSKRDVHNTTTNNSSNNSHHTSNINPNSNSSNSSSNYAVSQCSMPAYPKQYSTQNQSTHSHPCPPQQQQQPPTNINMQTQTITSTLAANYCPEDSHLNTHSNNLISTNTHHSSSVSTSHSVASTNNKQLPVCTTSKNCLNPKEHFLPNDTSLDDDYLSECENCKIAQSSKYYLDAEALASGPQETMTLQRKSMEECKEEPETGYYRISHTLPTNSKKNAPVKNNNREQWFSTIPAASSSSEEDMHE